MESGELNPREEIAVTLTRHEWVNLLRALRESENSQLGRLAWMSLSRIEGTLAGVVEGKE